MKQPHFEDVTATLSNLIFQRLKQGRGSTTPAKSGASIIVAINASPDFLDTMDPMLKHFFFRKAVKDEQIPFDMENGEVRDEVDPDKLVALRFAEFEPWKIKGKWERYEVQIAGALEGSELLGFVDATIKELQFNPLEGGTVVISFKASFPIDEDESTPLLGFWNNQGIRITLIPPAVEVHTDDEQED